MNTTTAIRERPILFSGPMVRAILDGRKTQTRRIVKPQHAEGIETDNEGRFSFMHAPDCGGYCDYACAAAGEVIDGHIGWTPWGSNPKHWGRLWVRETWAHTNDYDGNVLMDGRTALYAADDNGIVIPSRWRPSIHMPRWASRITLEIVNVRVERLQEISGEQAIAEGVRVLPLQSADDPSAWFETGPGENQAHCAIHSFRKLWDKLNGKRGYSWQSNPWVWIIEFRRIKP